MSQPAEVRRRITFAEFCELTPVDDRRYELIDGQIVCEGEIVPYEDVVAPRDPTVGMNQGSPRHAFLVMSLGACLRAGLAGRCQVLGPVGVYCEATGEGFGPDIIVTCERPRLDPVKGRAVVNPRAILEILSPSTERIDRGTKLSQYRTLESLQEYALVSQYEKLVQIYRRHGRDGWLLQDVRSGTFEVCGAAVSVDAVYEGIDDVPLVE